jgi:hypothetical protein
VLHRFWDSTVCFPKRTVNEKCLTNYYCRSDLGLSCQNRVCNCGSCGYWNHTTCFYSTCPTDWTYYRGSCFWSSNIPRNLVNMFGVAWITNQNCLGQPNSRLAVLHNSDFNNSCLTAANGFANYSWFDAYRGSGDPFTYYAIKTSGTGNNITVDANWENYNSLDFSYRCAVWNSVTRQFKAEKCNLGGNSSVSIPIICEIPLI